MRDLIIYNIPKAVIIEKKLQYPSTNATSEGFTRKSTRSGYLVQPSWKSLKHNLCISPWSLTHGNCWTYHRGQVIHYVKLDCPVEVPSPVPHARCKSFSVHLVTFKDECFYWHYFHIQVDIVYWKFLYSLRGLTCEFAFDPYSDIAHGWVLWPSHFHCPILELFNPLRAMANSSLSFRRNGEVFLHQCCNSWPRNHKSILGAWKYRSGGTSFHAGEERIGDEYWNFGYS